MVVPENLPKNKTRRGTFSKPFIGLISVTFIVVLSVGFLMWGYFTSQAIIDEQGEIIA